MNIGETDHIFIFHFFVHGLVKRKTMFSYPFYIFYYEIKKRKDGICMDRANTYISYVLLLPNENKSVLDCFHTSNYGLTFNTVLIFSTPLLTSKRAILDVCCKSKSERCCPSGIIMVIIGILVNLITRLYCSTL